VPIVHACTIFPFTMVLARKHPSLQNGQNGDRQSFPL
jgi:hypothetical protein